MPKMKTCSSAKKRFEKKSKSVIKKASSGRRHLLTKKSSKRKRHLRKGGYVNPSDLKHILKLMPY